ncbi:MAG: YihY/virulence factor BrkB family protein [Bacteroidetes bacterium]|nr:YihY/virulence factor BrkB family protein [Bacteroidota bacterium]
MTRLEQIILQSPPVKLVTNWTKKIIVPGADDLSLFEIGRFFFKEMRNAKLNVRCAAVTYNFLMAIPPTMLFFFSLVAYLPLKGVQKTILETLKLIIPNSKIYSNVSRMIVDFMNHQHGDILSIGILLTIFYSSNGIMGLIRSFEKSHLSMHVERSGFRKRWVAIKLTMMLIGVVLLSIVALVIQRNDINRLLINTFGEVALISIKITSLIVVLGVVLCAIGVIYKYGPSYKEQVRFISVGSVFATVMSIVSTVVFFFMVNNFINYNKVYGSIGTLMAFMAWMWLNTFIILVGYELNVSILQGKISRENAVKESKIS